MSLKIIGFELTSSRLMNASWLNKGICVLIIIRFVFWSNKIPMISAKKLCLTLIFLAFTQICKSQNNVDSTIIKEVKYLVNSSNQIYYSETDSAWDLAKSAFEMSKNHGYALGMADALTTIGIVYDIYGDLAKAFSIYKQAYDIYDSLELENGKANSQYNIALILVQDAKYDEALSYCTESYDYYFNAGNDVYAANTASTIGNILLQKGEEIVRVIEQLEKAKSFYLKVNNKVGQASCINLQGDAYLKYEQFQEAKTHYEAASKMLLEFNNSWFLGYSYLGLSKSNLKLGNFDLALLNCEKGIEQYKMINHKLRIKELYQTKYEIYELKKEYKKALDNFKFYQMYNDSLYNEDQSRQLTLLKTEFETEKKEAEIYTLSQKSTIQALEIQQKNQGILVGLALLVLVLSGVYFIYKQRKSKNEKQQTELEQRFLRSQLNPHFISNALVAVQNYMLKNQPETASIYLAKFSKLMREILENSRKAFIPVANEIDMLTNYLDIHKLRLNNIFDYKITIDSNIDVDTDTIPPMFIQPFVENAIEHGIINSKDGLIEIILTKDQEYISIQIKDNGGGLQSSIKREHHNSLSSTIIQERMALFNKSIKNKIRLIIEDVKNEQGIVKGTKVELMVPFEYC